MNPTLYVPNPIAGWDVPSRSGIVGQSMRDCFCSGVWREDIFREVIFDDRDDLDAGPREDATKLAATVRLGRAAVIGLGSAVIRILCMSFMFMFATVVGVFVVRRLRCEIDPVPSFPASPALKGFLTQSN